MPIITNIEDLRRIARRKIPRAIFDYVERGSYDELTLTANRVDLDAIRLRQRVLIDVSKVSLASTMLGETVAMPVAVAPTGLTGLVHGDDIKHLDPRGERPAVFVNQVEDHAPFENPEIIAKEHPPFFEPELVPGE